MAEYAEKNTCCPIPPPDKILSDLHLTDKTGLLQVHPHLLTVRSGGLPQVWAVERILPFIQKNTSMQSVGRKRIRPRPLKIEVTCQLGKLLRTPGSVLEHYLLLPHFSFFPRELGHDTPRSL